MTQAARVTDACIGSIPGAKRRAGIVLTGNPMSLNEGLPRASTLDITICRGFTGVIVTGSATTIDAGTQSARVLDNFVGSYTGIIISGSSSGVLS